MTRRPGPGEGADDSRWALLPWGELRTVAGRAGRVIGVPHGTFDAGTEEIGVLTATASGAAAVIATGFCAERTGGLRLNVNRPTEGDGRRAGGEVATERARLVHVAYLAWVRAAAAGSAGLYVEIHGHRRTAQAGRIEVATAGVDHRLASDLLEAARDALGQVSDEGGVALGLFLEPLHRLHFTASAARRVPPFAEARRVLHVELPDAARRRPSARRAAAGLVASLLRALEAAS